MLIVTLFMNRHEVNNIIPIILRENQNCMLSQCIPNEYKQINLISKSASYKCI